MAKVNESNSIRFSVVIPTFNRCDMLRQAIEALCQQDDPGCTYEIVVVNHQDATDNTPEMVKNFAKQSSIPILYLCEPRYEKHYAVNNGFLAARGEILGLIDDDVIVDRDWVKNMVRVYDRNPEASCAGGPLTLRWVNGPPPKWIEPFKEVLGETNFGDKLIELTYPDAVIAGNFSIRKEMLIKTGGYSPCNAPGDRMIGDGESGLCLKVYEAGGRIFRAPDVRGWHVQDARWVTPAYMWRRGKFQGKSEAYTIYRRANGNSLRVLKEACVVSVRRVIYLPGKLIRIKSWKAKFIKFLYECELILGLNSYLVRIKTDSQLRQLVTRNDWLNV